MLAQLATYTQLDDPEHLSSWKTSIHQGLGTSYYSYQARYIIIDWILRLHLMIFQFRSNALGKWTLSWLQLVWLRYCQSRASQSASAVQANQSHQMPASIDTWGMSKCLRLAHGTHCPETSRPTHARQRMQGCWWRIPMLKGG